MSKPPERDPRGGGPTVEELVRDVLGASADILPLTYREAAKFAERLAVAVAADRARRDAEYTERLADLEKREKEAWDEVHVQSARNQRLVEDLHNNTSNTVRMVVGQRDKYLAERDAALLRAETGEARLKMATDMLTEIAEYETDWTFGAAVNVATLQQLAENALAAMAHLAASPVRGSRPPLRDNLKLAEAMMLHIRDSGSAGYKLVGELMDLVDGGGTAGEDDHG